MSYSVIVPYTEGAAALIPNILSGTSVEFMGSPSKLTIYGSADTAGDTFSLTGFTGSEPGAQYVPTSPISVGSTTGAVKTNENFICQIPVPAGTRLVMPVAGPNTHVGRFLFVIE